MKTDHYFEIGSTHDVCQDFALSGKTDRFTFSIIADGCSESHKNCGEVDFGARIISYLARDAIFNIPFERLTDNEIELGFIGSHIREKIIENIIPLRKQLRLHELFADSTIVIALTDGTITYSYVFGDGGIITTKKDNETEYNEINFMSSAPYYLSYLADEERKKAYQLYCGASPVVHSQYIIPWNGDMNELKSYSKLAPSIDESLYEFSSFIFKDIASISVVSDGIKSFQNLSDGTKDILAINMVSKFVGFKNTNGSFVQRRMNFLKKENVENNIFHYDDISIASIVF